MKKALGVILALVLGFLPGFFIVFNSVFSDSNGAMSERLVTFFLTGAAFGLLGLVFGFLAPKESWRWGLWLSFPALLILVLFSVGERQNILLQLFYLVLTIASACLSAYAGMLLRNKHFSKEKTNEKKD